MKRRLRAFGAFSRPSTTSIWFLIFPSPAQAGEFTDRLHRPVEVIEDQEAAHSAALEDEVDVVPDCGPLLESAVAGDGSAEDDARADREIGERRVEHLAADVVEENVDSGRARLAETGREILGLVVDRIVGIQFVPHPLAFTCPARDAHDTTALELGDLADDRSDCPRRGGDDHRLAGFGLSHIEQAEVGGEPGDAEE